MSSPQVAQRMLGDVGASDIKENTSPKVEQLVITPFDEGTTTSDVYIASWFSSETLALYKSLTYLLTYLTGYAFRINQG